MNKRDGQEYAYCLCGLIVWVRVVPKRTVVGDIDGRFDNLSASHQQYIFPINVQLSCFELMIFFSLLETMEKAVPGMTTQGFKKLEHLVTFYSQASKGLPCELKQPAASEENDIIDDDTGNYF